MKTKKSLLLILMAVSSIIVKAQSISCSSFCATNIQIDTTGENTLRVSLFMGGTSDFIHYPYISLIANNNGDTLATSNSDFFGHSSNTTQVYTVNTKLKSIPLDFTCTIYLRYYESNNPTYSTCTLTYPCISTAINENDFFNTIQVYPNPSTGKFIVQNKELSMSDYEVRIYNTFGQNIYSMTNSNPKKENEIDLSSYPKGIYFIEINNKTKTYRKKIIID